ncbi:hypothetical protein [Rhodococcus opacus]|nr:hypothetical protein [Rhodococcus opacus]
MTDQAAFLDLEGLPAVELLADLKEVILHAYHTTPRHMQVEIGPSEYGQECARKLAFQLMQAPGVPKGDPLPSIVGTATHTWLQAAIEKWNAHIGRVRYIPEARVTAHPGPGGTGSCDVFDFDTGTVIDWKLPGTTRFSYYKRKGPSTQYRVQAHTYGRGYANLGFDVKRVAICFLPRGGMLSNAHLWSEPYDPQIPVTAERRMNSIVEICDELRLDQHPDRFRMIAPTPGDDCTFCPWFHPNPTTYNQCEGNAKS